jgi:hypothetical protein
MGGFWSAIFCFINENGIWPKVCEMLEVTDKGNKTFGIASLDRETPNRIWRQNERQVAFEDLPGQR